MATICGCGGRLILRRETLVEWLGERYYVGELLCSQCAAEYIDDRNPDQERPGRQLRFIDMDKEQGT